MAGGTGFIGSSLIPVLLSAHHEITVIGRQVKKIHALFKKSVSALSWDELNTISPDSFDAVINLAGENIAAQNRWTSTSKKLIKNSRLDSTQKLVQWCLQSKKPQNKKIHLYNASAVSIYGTQKSNHPLPNKITESSPINPEKENTFLTDVAECWENETTPLINSDFPVTVMRFAVVLKKHQGLLKKLELSFSLGLGTILGEGNQAFSWISIHDLVSAIVFLLNRPEITGPVNFSSPQCVSQKEFARTLAKIYHRPLFLKLPASLIKLIFGQMGEECLLSGQQVYPERLLQLGFKFEYPDLDSALFREWQQTN